MKTQKKDAGADAAEGGGDWADAAGAWEEEQQRRAADEKEAKERADGDAREAASRIAADEKEARARADAPAKPAGSRDRTDNPEGEFSSPGISAHAASGAACAVRATWRSPPPPLNLGRS